MRIIVYAIQPYNIMPEFHFMRPGNGWMIDGFFFHFHLQNISVKGDRFLVFAFWNLDGNVDSRLKFWAHSEYFFSCENSEMNDSTTCLMTRFEQKGNFFISNSIFRCKLSYQYVNS